jgi:hypothetical protein
MNRNKGKLSLEHTHELIDILEELEQIPHPMAEKLYAKFEDFVAQEGFDESDLKRPNTGYTLVFDPSTMSLTKENN